MKQSCIANWNVGVHDVAALQSTKGNTEGSVFMFDMPLVKFNKRVLQGSFYLNLLLRYIS